MDDAQRNELIARSKRVADLEADLSKALEERNAHWVALAAENVGASEIAPLLGIHRVTVQRILDREREIRRRVARETGQG